MTCTMYSTRKFRRHFLFVSTRPLSSPSLFLYYNTTPAVHVRQQQAEYGSYPKMVSPGYRRKQLKPLNDRFCLAEGCLLADVVEHLQAAAGKKAFHPRYNLTRWLID